MIGPYRILRCLGEGGMGAVYLAARADEEFHKQVAIKVIRKGMNTQDIIGRFRLERQILASLDHPNIAKLFDGGTTEEDGLPYFVMEYISGEPLNEFCDGRHLGLKERLKLFQAICSAVHYAHQNLVIHRDLKPVNILVTPEGTPKLLDFGIAKLLSSAATFTSAAPPTATGSILGTPDYMAPEQVRGEALTTATDVYSLGVILYELLSGKRPHDSNAGPIHLLRAICEQEPAPPSESLRDRQQGTTGGLTAGAAAPAAAAYPWQYKQLSGDLDNIVLMALRKEPQHRYVSAQALADDIGRHLKNEAVLARHSTWSYRAGKYIRRHAAAVAAASIAVLLLAGFAVTTTIQNARIRQERDRSEQVTRLLVGLFEVSDPEQARGKAISATEILDRGARRIHEELKNEPDVRAQLAYTIGDIYLNIDEMDRAESLLKESLDLRRKLYGDGDRRVADSMNDLSLVHLRRGEWDKAENLLRKALEIRISELGSGHPDVAETIGNLAIISFYKERFDEAERLDREVIAIHRKSGGSDNPRLAVALVNLGNVLTHQKRFDEAEALFREAIAIERKTLGSEHPSVAMALANLGHVLRAKGNKLDEAEQVYREALSIRRKVLGNEHTYTTKSMSSLARLLFESNKLPEAENLYREALEIRRKTLGETDPGVLHSRVDLAEVLAAEGNCSGAVALSNEVLGVPAGDGASQARAKGTLAACLMQRKDYAEAERMLLDAYKVLKTSQWGSKTCERLLQLYSVAGNPQKASEIKRNCS